MAKTLQLFAPHPNLTETVNCHIIQSEIEGGVFLADLPPATVLRIRRSITITRLYVWPRTPC